MKPEIKKNEISPYSMLGIGFEFAGIVLIPAALGYFGADYFISRISAPYGMIAGLLAGFSYGVYYLYQRGKDYTASASQNQPKPRSVKDEADSIRSEINDLADRYDKLIKNQEKKNK